MNGVQKQHQRSLPTLDKLGSQVPKDLDAQKVAEQWFKSFSENLQAGKIDKVLDLLLEDAFWRDMLAFTWDFRTFEGRNDIKQFLSDQLAKTEVSSLELRKETVVLSRPYSDIAWIEGLFDFKTKLGVASGVFRLVPVSSGEWKAYNVFSNLESLAGFPELTGFRRDFQPNHGKWALKRQKEMEYTDHDPTVLIVGGGQSGLDVAARLKTMGVDALVCDKNERIGDNWRKRYEALCLHDPVWYDHMPYIPFPSTWPVYTPALKLADWLANYAHALELNVWTSARVVSAKQLPASEKRKWAVTVVRGDGAERILKVNHIVFAVGFGGSVPNMPSYPGMDVFKGPLLHSSEHKRALDHAGKKVVVVGACTSAHDICADYYEHGVDVTMYQRNPTYIMSTKEGMPRLFTLYWENAPPTDVADRLHASVPNHLMKMMHIRLTKDIAEADKEILDGLQKRGFKLGWGDEGSGFLRLAYTKGGGYYLDVGASQLVIDGKIKLKNDSQIERFTENGIKFQNGSEIPADAVIFATGWGDARIAYREILGDAIYKQLKPVWGLDEEGEFNSAYRDLGVDGVWCMMGNLALCRFHSKHVALQIKAMEEGIFGPRY